MREKQKKTYMTGPPRPRVARVRCDSWICLLFLRGFGKTGLADLLRDSTRNGVAPGFKSRGGAAGVVAKPMDIMRTVVASESIRRVAVHVFPRARFGSILIYRQTTKRTILISWQTTTRTAGRGLVLVLVKRLLRIATEPHTAHRATAAAPLPGEVLRLDLAEGPFLCIWAFSDKIRRAV